MSIAYNGRRWEVGTFAVALLWLGLLLGVSFLATPVKFQAPSLTLPVALDVGRHTFALFNKLEWALSIGLLLAVLGGARALLEVAAAGSAATIVFVETVWLLPSLDHRVGMIMAGQQPPASSQHYLYIGVELLKLVALLIIAAATARRLVRQAPDL
jgi:hypothetical protein